MRSGGSEDSCKVWGKPRFPGRGWKGVPLGPEAVDASFLCTIPGPGEVGWANAFWATTSTRELGTNA